MLEINVIRCSNMAQFNFGSNLGAAPNTSSNYGFGAPNKTITPGFGAPQAQTQPSGSITFGTPIASVAPNIQSTPLGAPPAFGAQTGLSFGAPAAAPTSGLAFGAPAPASSQALNFAMPSATKAPTLGFGAAPAQPSVNFNAGSNATPGLGLQFGAPATLSAATPSLFGTPATPASSAGLSFGATPVSQNMALRLGATSTASSLPNPLAGINFGAPVASSPGVLNFGAPAASTVGGLSFGNPAVSTAGGLNFGTPAASTAGGLSFGATPAVSTAGSLSFGATPTSQVNPNPLGGINFGTVAPSTTFNLGSTSTAATPSLNFGLGGTTPATLNFKSFTTPGTTGIGATPVSAPSLGLGGVDSSSIKTGTVTTGANDKVAAKENQVPNEILQSIENFKQFVKDQKSQSSDVSRGSARPFVKVKEDIELINNILIDVGNDLQRNQQQADKLKLDSAKCLNNAEMAQRTNDIPPGLQFENTAPLKYFIELVNQFEQDLQALRVQIDVTDKHFQSLHEPKFLTSQELSTGMRRLHDTFVALAGRLHSVHTQVESQKEQYLNLRKYILKDPTDIFMKPMSKEAQALDVVLRGLGANKTISGPTPFSSFGAPFGVNMIVNQQQQTQTPNKPPPAYPSNNISLSFGTSASNTGVLGYPTAQLSGTSLFGNPGGTNPAFPLQNPPLGNKRGKR